METRWTRLFIPTLREGDRILERAAFTRQGNYLPLGRRSLWKIERIAREELNAAGAQEVLVPEDHSMAALARELRSYKQLPQIWYQIQGPHLEACSLDASQESCQARHAALSQSFDRILQRCVVAFTRAGSFRDDLKPESFHTPGRKTIADLAEFTALPATSHIKSLVLIAGEKPGEKSGEKPVMVLVRGDHQLSEEKLRSVLRAPEVRPANTEEIRGLFGAGAGSLGPVGVRGVRILADDALRGRRNMIAGANKDDYHLRNVTPGKDFEAEFSHLRRDTEDGDPIHDGETLRFGAMELVWLEQDLGPTLHITDESGHEIPICAGSYGINLDGILCAAAEQHQDQDGLVLPASIAPFDLIVTPVNFTTDAQRTAAVEIAEAAQAAGLDVLLDDRDERPGVKFKDADLIGVPWRVTVGKKVEEGLVEIVNRRDKERTGVPVTEAADFLLRMSRSAGQ